MTFVYGIIFIERGDTMKKYSKSFTIKVTSLATGKVYSCNSIIICSKKIGVSRHILSSIKRGRHSSFVTGINDKVWQIEFVPDVACTLYPAWDNRFDEEPIGEQTFSSHTEAIRFLSGEGPDKRHTYYRRMSMQPLGEPCAKPIEDNHGFTWIITFYKDKGTFVPNKKDNKE
jgi:hypothetical protein